MAILGTPELLEKVTARNLMNRFNERNPNQTEKGLDDDIPF